MARSSRLSPQSLADRLLAQGRSGSATNEDLARAAERSFRPVERALLIPLERIEPWDDNPRLEADHNVDDLAASIAERGILQSLVVRRDPRHPGHYITIAGARRVLAARKVSGSPDPIERARVAELPCIVREETDEDAYADALAENLARQDLTREESMAALERLHITFGWSVRQIHRRTGLSLGNISELLNLAKDDEVVHLVHDKTINASVGVAIRRLPEPLRPLAVEEARDGRLKTVKDVNDLHARREQPRRVEAMPTTTVASGGTEGEGEVFVYEHPEGAHENQSALTVEGEVFVYEHPQTPSAALSDAPQATFGQSDRTDDAPLPAGDNDDLVMVSEHLRRKKGAVTPHRAQIHAEVERLARDVAMFVVQARVLDAADTRLLDEAGCRLIAYAANPSLGSVDRVDD